jgi:hypothetical protein
MRFYAGLLPRDDAITRFTLRCVRLRSLQTTRPSPLQISIFFRRHAQPPQTSTH